MKTKLLLASIFIGLLLKGQNTQKWLQLGTGLNKNQTFMPSMAFDRNGNLYLAYTDQSTPQNKATLKKFDGQVWSTVSSQFTPGQAQFVTLVLDTGDMPCVAFQEPYPVTKRITVMRFNGTGWDTIGSRGFALAHFNNPELSMRIDNNNNYHVAFREDATGKASIARNYFGLGWNTNNSMNITQGNATKLSYNFEGDYLAFSNGSKGGKLSVLTSTTGGSWVYVGDTTLSAGAVDYVSCRRYANTGGFITVVTYKDLSDGKAYCCIKGIGNVWTSPIQISSGTANYISITRIPYDSYDGNFYCAYSDVNQSGNATVKKINGAMPSGSVSVGKEGFTDTLGIFAGAFYATLGMDKQDSLYLAVQSMNEYVVFKYRNVNTNPTGLEENHISSETHIYPNPTSGILIIYSESEFLDYLKIFNSNGELLFHKKDINESEYTLYLSTYSQGLYFLECRTGSGIKRTKILKE